MAHKSYRYVPRDIKPTIEGMSRFFDTSNLSDVRDINPRLGKQSFFIGGEYKVISDFKGKNLVDEKLVKAACKKILKCKQSDVYWRTVYLHSGEHKVFSISNSTILGAKITRAGVIMIKIADVPTINDDTAIRMLERELSEYSIWVNTPIEWLTTPEPF